MVPFTYRCPRTGQQVQGWAAADQPSRDCFPAAPLSIFGEASYSQVIDNQYK